MNERQEDKKKQFILVIDDDQGQLDTLADILESEELQPICCSTGKRALEAVNQHEVNVAILDLRLPDIDGLEVLKRLKKKNPGIKVIVNTAYASLESALTAINEQAFAYVKKLGDVEELLAHVHRAFHAHFVEYSEKLESEVNKRKQAEQELERQSRLSHLFLESMPCVALLITNYSRIIEASNSQGEKMGAVPGKTCYESWRLNEKPCSFCEAPKLWAKGTKQHKVIEVFGVIWDIHWIPVDENTYLHYAFDITERVTLEEKLRQQNKMEAIGQITAGIAHQLNSPLGVVSARLELLFEQFKKEKKEIIAKNIGNLLENVEKMSNIIKGVLNFSRISGSKKEKTDINKVFKQVLFLLESKAKKNQIIIEKKLDKNIPAVNANFNQMEQVFMNIIINAFDALPKGGKLNIRNKKTAWKNKHYVSIEFNDTGTGMSKEVMAKLFEPFFTTKPVGRGTGLGMSIAHEIIKEHGGEILLGSTKIMGTKITVLLPVDEKREK